MLSESSYQVALYFYIGAALMTILCMSWWIGRRWPNFWTALIILLSAALMLTPAYPKAGVDTFAPALIVAAFQIFTDGFESAQHAIKPLTVSCGVAVVLAIVLRVLVLRPRKNSATPEAADTQNTTEPEPS